jgi:hypothetical protein
MADTYALTDAESEHQLRNQLAARHDNSSSRAITANGPLVRELPPNLGSLHVDVDSTGLMSFVVGAVGSC